MRNKTSQQAGLVKPTEEESRCARAELFIYQTAAKQPNPLGMACSNQALCQERQRPRPLRAWLFGLATSAALQVINKQQVTTRALRTENNSPQRREPVTQGLDTEPVIFQARVLRQAPSTPRKRGLCWAGGSQGWCWDTPSPPTQLLPSPHSPCTHSHASKTSQAQAEAAGGAGKPAGTAGRLVCQRIKPLRNNSARVRAG